MEMPTLFGIPTRAVDNQPPHVLDGMLVLGLICNLLVRPLDHKWCISDKELSEVRRLAHKCAAASDGVCTARCKAWLCFLPDPVRLIADPACAVIEPAGSFKNAQFWETMFTIVQQLPNEHANTS
jgi:hypothetical protein